MKNIKPVFFLIFYCSLNFTLFGSEFSDPQKWDHHKILGLLKSEPISIISMRKYLKTQNKLIDFDNEVYLVTLKNGIKAVFKPGEDCLAEVCAYEASIFLGFPYIPPIILTSINGKKASLQLFIDTKIDPLAPNVYKNAFGEASNIDVANLKLFWFVFGQWDTGPHNIMILKNKSKTFLISIDNEGISNKQYVKYGELPFVSILYSDKFNTDDWWNTLFPFNEAVTIYECNEKKLRSIFNSKVPERFYLKFRNRLPFTFKYVIYQNKLWRQFHTSDKSFIKSYTEFFPKESIIKLEKLNIKILNKIFSQAKGTDFFTKKYIESILERRDQVLKTHNTLTN